MLFICTTYQITPLQNKRKKCQMQKRFHTQTLKTPCQTTYCAYRMDDFSMEAPISAKEAGSENQQSERDLARRGATQSPLLATSTGMHSLPYVYCKPPLKRPRPLRGNCFEFFFPHFYYLFHTFVIWMFSSRSVVGFPMIHHSSGSVVMIDERHERTQKQRPAHDASLLRFLVAFSAVI